MYSPFPSVGQVANLLPQAVLSLISLLITVHLISLLGKVGCIIVFTVHNDVRGVIKIVSCRVGNDIVGGVAGEGQASPRARG